jgi:hypothetical protein
MIVVLQHHLVFMANPTSVEAMEVIVLLLIAMLAHL